MFYTQFLYCLKNAHGVSKILLIDMIFLGLEITLLKVGNLLYPGFPRTVCILVLQSG